VVFKGLSRLYHFLYHFVGPGMPITSIRRLLGYDKLETTLIYARVHNETVQRDYERAQAFVVSSVASGCILKCSDRNGGTSTYRHRG
jgi:hypothetical protein